MEFDINTSVMRELVDEDAELERLATGFMFTEGPLWNPDGFLRLSEIS
jgi:gluconolactonase